MKTKIFSWLDREFVEISGEGRVGVSTAVATTELFEKFDASLKAQGLSLDNTVRVRVWSRDRQGRADATAARSRILSGNRRAASSSFISQQWFDSASVAGLDLLAMRPLHSAAVRKPVDFEPARNHLRYLELDSLLFFSGFTSEAATLVGQVEEVLATLDDTFAQAKTHWGKVKKLSLFLQRGADFEAARSALVRATRPNPPEVEFGFVDGFAGEKNLLEIEATALIG